MMQAKKMHLLSKIPKINLIPLTTISQFAEMELLKKMKNVMNQFITVPVPVVLAVKKQKRIYAEMAS